MGIMENLTYDQFKEFIKKNKLVMATFGAPWCGACRSLGPIVEEIIGEVKDGIAILKVNVDESPNISQTFFKKSAFLTFNTTKRGY